MSGSILLRASLHAGVVAVLSTSALAQTLPLKSTSGMPRALPTATTDRIIVRLREDAAASDAAEAARKSAQNADRVAAAGAAAMSAERARQLSDAALMTMAPVRVTGSGAHVMRLPREMSETDVDALVARLKQDPTVAGAEADRRRFALLVPTDVRYPIQWNLQGAPGGVDAERAWNTTQGSANTVVAVLDTGILRNHRELLGGRVLAGYDFVSADANGVFVTANDGNARDADPADPGDFVSAGEAGQGVFVGCPAADSSWHGTHIAGIIAANSNDAIGMAGINWNTRILPVRVLGKCGGYASDAADGLRWAAGLSVPGVPNNTTPAQVVNMSIGGPGACANEEQTAIDAALAAGVRAIVAASGNDAGSSLNISPANCQRLIAVTGVDRTGSRATQYANVGANIAIAAPGGSFVSAQDLTTAVLSLSDTGTTVPVADALSFAIGTSEAAAHVSGVVSLMLAVNPNLSPYQVYWVLRQSARAFPNATCTTAICGAGIADANAAVLRATTPPANPASGGLTFTPAPVAAAPAPTPTPAPAPTPTPTPTPAPVASPAPSATPSAPAASSTASAAPASTSSSGDGGGGCTMSQGGEPDWLLALLASIALLRVGRRTRAVMRAER